MILFREAILEALRDEQIQVEGFSPSDPEWMERIQSGSIDMQVGTTVSMFRNEPGLVNLRMPRRLTQIDETLYVRRTLGYGETFVIEPLQFMLVDVDARIRLGNSIAAYVEGKSTVGRSGLFVVNAGFVEPGFSGRIVLELLNTAPFPIEVASGDDICQIVLVQGDRETAYPYGAEGLRNRYQFQDRAQPPRPRGNLYGGAR